MFSRVYKINPAFLSLWNEYLPAASMAGQRLFERDVLDALAQREASVEIVWEALLESLETHEF